ncbi:MAG: cytochrome C [Gemmatimonadetes bacterium]|nr:MAG: cytochrome C [Gemmatimonadota bacterium]
MKLILKLIGSLVLLAILGAVGMVVFLFTAFPKVSPPAEITIEITPERLARGAYLANHVTVCIDCHSKRNWDFYGGPPIAGTEGQGGELFPEVGRLYAPNITPAALGDWTDGELLRAVSEGVDKNGEPLFPLMPYRLYAHMDQEDLYSILAYIKTLKPIENAVPRSQLKFPLNLIVRTIPQPANFQPKPAESDSIAYGKYLATIGGCIICHTPQEKGQMVPGMEFAGGFEIALSNGQVARGANITPHEKTGIGGWTRAQFIQQFKKYELPENQQLPAEVFNTPMPWVMYAGMTEADLGAIYAYLRTLKPVDHAVEKFEIP